MPFPKRSFVIAVLALGVQVHASCTSSTGGGTDCFSPVHGPAAVSCAGFTVGLSCPVDLQPFYSCVCTARVDAGPQWVCAPNGAGGGTAGTGGSGGSSSSSAGGGPSDAGMADG